MRSGRDPLGSASGDEIQPADPAARRRALLILIVLAALGLALIALLPTLLAAVERWVLHDPAQQASRLRFALIALWLLIALPGFGFTTALWRLARRSASAERFPPQQHGTVRPVRIRRGADAYRAALGLRLLALLLAAALLALLPILLRLAALLPAPAGP